MDFGEILNEWEKEKKKKKQKIMEKYVDSYLPDTPWINEKKMNQYKNFPGESREKMLKMKPERVLDLHGMHIKEALGAVDLFLRKCRNDGIKKVLIIHGKGKHSREPYLLAKKIREYIQKNPLTGEYGVPDRKAGGSGALWVIIRSK